MLQLFSLTLLATSLLAFFLGVVVFLKGRDKALNRMWLLTSSSIGFWSLGISRIVISDTYKEGWIWNWVLYSGAIFIPIFHFHFFKILTNLRSKISNRFLVTGYFLSSLFFISNFTKFFVKDIPPVFYFKHWVEPGVLYYPFFVFFSVYMLANIYVLASRYRQSCGVSKKQIKNVLISAIFGVIGSTTVFFPQIIGLYPFGSYLIIVYLVGVTYTIIRHHLMDIKFVLRRSSVYLLSLSTVILLATFFKYVFSRLVPEMELVDELVVIFVTIIIFPYIKEYFSYISNKYFFASLYNIQEVITRFSDKLSSILEIDKLLETIVSEVNKSFYPKSMSIFLYNEKDSKYYAAFSAGDSYKKRESFELSKKIFDKYLDDRNVLVMSELREKSESDYHKTLQTFLNKDIKIIVPLSIKDREIGLFLMGEKESGEAYNSEDIQLLQILATQSSFALDNSLKFEEAKNFNILLEREVEKAVMELQKANGELRTLDTAKSDFISIASHQLRTPLTVIKGYVSMILEGNFGKLPDPAREPTEKIYDSNERLIKLVEQLLSISRIESGRIKYDFEETNLSDIVLNVIEGVRYGAIKKGLDLSYAPPKGFVPMVNIDTVKMKQIIGSLIDNSIKYTYKTEEKRGFVLIRIEDLKDKNKIRLSIEDNGMGIKEEDKVNLFKKFSRGKDISTVYTEGTGLGLYVAKQIIEAHSGSIYAESRGRNMGTKIYFDLPKIETEK